MQWEVFLARKKARRKWQIVLEQNLLRFSVSSALLIQFPEIMPLLMCFSPSSGLLSKEYGLQQQAQLQACLLYTSDAADECVNV